MELGLELLTRFLLNNAAATPRWAWAHLRFPSWTLNTTFIFLSRLTEPRVWIVLLHFSVTTETLGGHVGITLWLPYTPQSAVLGVITVGSNGV